MCRYDTDAQRAEDISLLDGAVRQRLLDALTDSALASAVTELCGSHGLPIMDAVTWRMEGDLNIRTTVARARITAHEAAIHLTARAAITSPDPRSPGVKVISEIWLSQLAAHTATEANEAAKDLTASPLLSLLETRDLLSAALETAVFIGERHLPAIYQEDALPRTDIEVHIERHLVLQRHSVMAPAFVVADAGTGLALSSP